MKLLNKIKNNEVVVVVMAFVYNMLFSKCRYAIITGHMDARGSLLKNTSCKIYGGGKVVIGKKSRLTNCKIEIKNEKCSLILGRNLIIKNVTFWIEDDNSSIEVGNGVTIESGHIASTEGKKIEIGDGCMLSNDIEIRNGDSHPIFDKEKSIRINSASDVKIGNGVWVAAHVRILKGGAIANGCVIGCSSVVTQPLIKEECIYAGNPAKLLKENVEWVRDRDFVYKG